MKKRSLVFLVLVAFVVGTMFSTSAAEAGTSVTSLQKQIKTLKATVSTQKSQIAKKDKQISGYKNTISSKDKEIKTYRSNAVQVSKTKVAYQGNVISGNYQIGNVSVPAIMDYKGVRYAPVNMIGDLLGASAIYNKNSNTVNYGTDTNGSYMSDILKPYFNTSTITRNSNMWLAGQKYNKGFQMEFYDDYAYTFNLNGKYSNIKGVLGIDDNSGHKRETEITFYGDGEVLASYVLQAGELPLDVNIDISNVKNFMIYCPDGYADIDFANVIIK